MLQSISPSMQTEKAHLHMTIYIDFVGELAKTARTISINRPEGGHDEIGTILDFGDFRQEAI
jgi:hypothetical protein